MVDAVISRGGTSVSLPIVKEQGEPVVTANVGHPSLSIQQTATINPRHIDERSILESYNILGTFYKDDPYGDAIQLVDLIKSNSNGNQLTLDLTSLPEYDSVIDVAPAASQDQALSVAYVPGRREWVDVDIALTRVSGTRGGANQPAETPTASGSGPITLSYNGTSVPLERDIEVQRSVGRPQSVTRATTQQYPYYQDKYRAAYEGFELSFQFGSDTVAKIQDLLGMFRQQLGRDSLTLDFGGIYGMGEFSVVPDGSGALRHVRRTSEQGVVHVPTISLRRVFG